MDLVHERHAKTAELHRQLNMSDMVALVMIRQLRFLTLVANRDESQLTRQVRNGELPRYQNTRKQDQRGK